MGDFKDNSIPEAETLDSAAFLDDMNEWSDEDTEGLRAQTILTEVSLIGDWLTAKLDRMKYYEESVTRDEIEYLIAETQRIERDLG